MDNTKFSGFSGSYKAGKTVAGVHKSIQTLNKFKTKGLIAEPNYRMAHDILTPVFEKFLKEYKIDYAFSSSENTFKTEFGDVIVRTLEKRSALEGHNIGWFYVDEFDLMKLNEAYLSWGVLISKLTIGDVQRGFVTGTNEGYNFLYNKFVLGSQVETRQCTSLISKTKFDRTIYSKENYKLFVSPIYENENNLPTDYIPTMMANYDEKLIERYMLGKFINIQSGKVYYSFSDKNITSIEFDNTAETYLSWDINYSDRMMCTSLIQKFAYNPILFPYADPLKDVYVCTKFFGNRDTNTETQCKIILEFLEKNNFIGTLKEYGDRVGEDRRVGASRSHYTITSEYFSHFSGYEQQFKATRKVTDRVASVNRLFNNSIGFKQLYINKDQTILIDDLEQTSWKSNSMELDGRSIDRTDATDSLSYYCYYEHDVNKSEWIWN